MIYRVLDISAFGEEDYLCAYEELPLWRQEKVRRYSRVEDKRRCVFSYALLISLIRECTETHGAIDIYPDEKGKLKLQNIPMGISISHSGNFVAACVHSGEAGIDIETVRDVTMSVINRALNEEEREYLCLSGDESVISAESLCTERFFELWTAKEAYVKFTGEGLSGLKSAVIDTSGKLSVKNSSCKLLAEKTDRYILSVVYE